MEQINKYQNGKIYTIRSYQTDKFYIGSTCNMLSKRFNDHKKNYNKYKSGNYYFTSSYDIIKFDDAYIELLENFSCNDRNELNKREGELIRLHKENIVNIRNSNNNEIQKKESKKISDKKYYDTNKIKLIESQKIYIENNKEKINEYKRNWLREKRKNLKKSI